MEAECGRIRARGWAGSRGRGGDPFTDHFQVSENGGK